MANRPALVPECVAVQTITDTPNVKIAATGEEYQPEHGSR